MDRLRPMLNGPRSAHSPPETTRPSPSALETQVVRVTFRSGESIVAHPDLRRYLREGWTLRRASPCPDEDGGTCLAVLLTRVPSPAETG